MKEIWDLAISPAMLPLTILLGAVCTYWLIGVIGLAGHGGHHGHGHHDIGGHHHGHGGHQGHVHGHSHHLPGQPHHGPHAVGNSGHDRGDGDDSPISGLFHGVLRVVNAQEVPLMIVLSVLVVFLWGGSMVGNVWFPPSGSGLMSSAIVLASLIASVFFTRLTLIPVKPLFRMLQEDVEKEIALIGRTGFVRTGVIDEKYGQIVVENRGAPIVLGARIADGAEPIPRNTTVLVVSRDDSSGLYVVRAYIPTSH